MTVPKVSHDDVTQAAEFETISRLVAALLNEGYAQAVPAAYFTRSGQVDGLMLQDKGGGEIDGARIWVALSPSGTNCLKTNYVFHPADFCMPACASPASSLPVQGNEILKQASLDVVVDTLCRPRDTWSKVVAELRNAASNQAAWLALSSDSARPNLFSTALQWEQALVTGHPSHPMHRTCIAQGPLQPVLPSDVPSLVRPQLSMVAVDSAAVRISGPFRKLLKPLLSKFDLPDIGSNEIAIPCLTRQMPAIKLNFPHARVLVENALTASAQASLRTVVLPEEFDFEWHLKLALACTVTSALRTITPWTACVGPELSNVLFDLLPENTWICREVASVTGGQDSFDEAMHISCVLRESHESRAAAMNQTMIIAAALAESPCGTRDCYAAVTFELLTRRDKLEWLEKYTLKLLDAILIPVLDSGICFEAHGQNVLVRIDKTTNEVVGFVVRDLGGVKCYTPKLAQKGYRITSALPGSYVVTENEEDAWEVVHHTLIQNHIQHLIRRLQVPAAMAWDKVRGQIKGLMASRSGSDEDKRFERFLFAPRTKSKAFLKMKLQGSYRNYEHTVVPNVLLTE